MGIPTGRQPLVARLRGTLFCLVLLRLGTGDGCFRDSRVRPIDRELIDVLVAGGHSLASFNLVWGWSRPDNGVNKWGLV